MLHSISPGTKQGFDYATLDAETLEFLQQQTDEIRGLMKRTARGIVEIGQKLIQVKERLGYGRFGEWLKAEFEWSYETAARFMRVCTQFNSVNLTELSIAPSALYLLAAPSTPEAVRVEALARAQAGESITHTTAKTIKQKYTSSSSKPKRQPAPQLQPDSSPAPAKREIVDIRPQAQALTPTNSGSSKADTSSVTLQQPSQSAAVSLQGIWWRLGGRHLLYCGNSNSDEFLVRVPEVVPLLLAFPPTNSWQPIVQSQVSLIMLDYLPICHNPESLDEVLEPLILRNSRLSNLVVTCFLPAPDILSIINRLDRHALVVEPDARRCNAVVSDWKKAGLLAERLSKGII